MAMIDFDIGTYGCQWMNWMEEHHKSKVREMKLAGNYQDVAKSIDNRAWDYYELLEKQYMEAHPYPNSYEENVAYHTTKNFYVDSTVMREVVLMAVTQP